MRKRTPLLVIVGAVLGAMLLCSFGISAAALTYIPALLRRVGVADRYTTQLDLLQPSSLTVTNPHGDVVVQSGDVAQVQVEAVKVVYSVTEASAKRTLGRVDVLTSSEGHRGRIEVVLPNPLFAQEPRVNLVLMVPRDTSLDVLSRNGAIRISLFPDASFVLDAQTDDGRIESGFSLTDQESGYTGFRNKGQWLKGRANGGSSVQLILRGGAGDITLKPQN